MDTLPRWAEMANDYLSAGLDSTSAGRWTREIKMNVANVTQADICEAIRMNKNVKLKRKVTVADIIGWISENMPSTEKRLKSCKLCNRGWLELHDGLGDEFTLEEYNCASITTLPCMCASGGHHLSTKYEADGAHIQGLRQKAFVQRQAYNKLVDQIDVDECKRQISENERNSVGMFAKVAI